MDDSTEKTALERSNSFDHSFWQRPPSSFSIKANRDSLRRQNTFPGSSVDDIPEVETDISTLSTSNIDIASNLDDTEPQNKESFTMNNESESMTPRSHHLSELQVSQVDIPSFSKDTPAADEISELGSCIECVKAIAVFSGEEIDEGDHIIFAGAVYDHHGIVVSKSPDGKTFEIIDATNTVSGVVVGLSKFFGGKAKIGSSEKEFNFSTQKIRVVEYRNRKYTKIDTVKRAREYLDLKTKKENKSEKYKYHLFENNCEHFATYCVTGNRFSIQVTKLRLTTRLFLMRGFIGISNELTRNEKEYENKIICRMCYEMNKYLLSVNIKPIKNVEDVQKGDIIRYTYWNLWHEAVVLEVTEAKTSYVKCQVAHYAFCGFLKHRTIKSEELKINFDGKCSMLEYKPPKYNVFGPEIVVDRAKMRLGEQQFVFFSNDSSHFARWCKLRLEK